MNTTTYLKNYDLSVTDRCCQWTIYRFRLNFNTNCFQQPNSHSNQLSFHRHKQRTCYRPIVFLCYELV